MAQAQQVQDRPKSSAGAKVTVACKLPHGIIMRPFRWITQNEPVMGGGSREVRVAEPSGEPVIINGCAVKIGADPKCRILAGYALTSGVDKDAWDQWLSVNKDSAMVRNGLIFADERSETVEGRCKEMRKTRSGLEPMEKDGDPRAPRKLPNMTAIAEEEGRAKKQAA